MSAAAPHMCTSSTALVLGVMTARMPSALMHSVSSISVLRVRAYTAEGARDMNEQLLQMGERLVNNLNTRSRQDLIRVAEQEVKVAEERAKDAANRALAIDAGNADALAALVLLTPPWQRWREAEVSYREALARKPRLAQLDCALGEVLAATGRIGEAVPHAEKALVVFTVVSVAPCLKEYGAPMPVAQGAATILINNQHAARVGDKLTCGAVILSGSSNVEFTDETANVLPIEPEVPPWLTQTLEVVALGAAVVGDLLQKHRQLACRHLGEDELQGLAQLLRAVEAGQQLPDRTGEQRVGIVQHDLFAERRAQIG